MPLRRSPRGPTVLSVASIDPSLVALPGLAGGLTRKRVALCLNRQFAPVFGSPGRRCAGAPAVQQGLCRRRKLATPRVTTSPERYENLARSERHGEIEGAPQPSNSPRR